MPTQSVTRLPVPTTAVPPTRSSTPAPRPLRTALLNTLAPAVRFITGGTKPVRKLGGASKHAKPSGVSGGQPLAPVVRTPIENSLHVDMQDVRVHTDAPAQKAAFDLSARAFAHGKDIFLGKGANPHDLGLLAHEAAHVIQQEGAPALQKFSPSQNDSFEREAHQASNAVVRGESFQVQHRTSPRVQKFGVSDVLDYFADKANIIPGFRMFTIILGVNPINMSSVDRSAANILRAVVEFIPGGGLITQALDNYGIFDKAGKWVDEQIHTLGMVGSSIKNAVSDFIDSLSWKDIFHLGDVWDRAKRIFTDPIDKIISFVKGLVLGFLSLIRDALLRPLAKLAEGTSGWDLLKAVLGQDPITGDPVPQTAETLIGGFMKLIGQEEIWNNIQKANALPRAWAWFKGALNGLLGFVKQVPSLIISTIKSIELMDIILLPRVFIKVGTAFAGFLGKFFSWAGETIWNLLQIIFEVVAPGAIPYLKKVGAAFKKILKDPISFVRNLVKAGKLGFQNFANNIGTHLKNALIEWLTGSLTSVYLPKALELKEIVKFVLSVLGISWANIRQKLVKATSENIVKGLEIGFEIVKKLITEGPAAAWEEIKTQLANLKDMVMGAIVDYVVETIVKKAVAKVLSLLVPGGAFIQAIISIYDTIMVFIEKLKKIIQVVMAFLDSIMAIANGAIAGAADKVESTLAGLLVLAINFLAGFLGLGKIADKVMNIINTKVRAPIDKALDFVINWIVKTAKGLFKALFGGKDDKKPATPEEAKWNAAVDGVKADLATMEEKGVSDKDLKDAIPVWTTKYGFKSLTVESKQDEWEIDGSMSPKKKVGSVAAPGTKSNPFKLTWPKPASSSYPILYLGGEINRIKTQGALKALFTKGQNDETGIKVRAYSPNSGGTLPGGQKIGISSSYRISVGTIVGPVTDATTPGGGKIINLLKKYGFSASGEDMDGDHVKEIQFGGQDTLENLWPLDAGTNRGAGSTLSKASVEFPKSGKTIKISELKQNARQYFFKITSVK
jgi:hypothetical protein